VANDATRDNRGQSKTPVKSSDSPKVQKAKRAPRWRLLSVLAALAVVAWFLPTIIVKTPLLPWVLKLATADVKGSVTVRSASLGWLSPIEVQGIEVKDAANKPVLAVDSVTGDRMLGSILFNYTNLGKFTLVGTKLSVAMRENGTNVEDMFAKYLTTTTTTKEKATTSNIAVAVEIVDGEASLIDEQTGLVCEVRKMTLKFGMTGGADSATIVDVATDLYDSRSTGKLSAGLRMGPTENSAKASITQFPLPMLRPILARLMPGTTLTGRLSSEVIASWGSKTPGKDGVAARLSVEGFSLGSRALKTDVLQLQTLQAECQASWQPDRLDIQKSLIQCDVGNASLTGTVPLGGKDGVSLKAIAHQPQEFSGTIDLARIAQMLPATLSLRQQMRLDSGQAQWVLVSRPGSQDSAWQWHGQFETASLKATDMATNRPIVWDKPLIAMFDAHDVAGGNPIVDRVTCQSDFLSVEGGGTTDNLTAKLAFNLDKLANQLKQFITMGDLQMAGDGSGNLAWRRSTSQQFDAGADIQVRGFQLGMTGQPTWREDSLFVNASAKGQTNFDANTRIDTASINMKSGFDQIDVSLLSPVKNLQGGGVWSVVLKMQGLLQNWPGRLAVWLPMKNVQMNGSYILQADGVASKDGADLRQMGFAAEPMVMASPWVNVNEKRVDATAAGSWNQSKRRLQVPSASFKCSTAAVAASNVVMAMPEIGPTEMAGNLNYEGDVGRMRQWFVDPKTKLPPSWQLGGQLKGSAIVQQTAGVIHGTTTAEVANLAVVDSLGKQVQEPIVRLVAQGDYSTQSKTLQLTQCEFTSSAVTAAAAGNMTPANGRNNAQLEGKVNYDLQRLSTLLGPCLGPNVRAAGRGSSSVSYRGPLSLAEGAGEATLHWDSANLYGFPLGPTDIKASMANGAAQIEPIDVAVSGGTVHLAPRVQFTSNPMELSLPKCALARKIQVNTAMCGSMLQYIAPALAGATSAQGSFSIDLDDCRIPFGDLNKVNVTGRFTVHSMVVSPGPMVHELAVFMSREAPAQLKQESVVPFQMVNGRVYHKNLQLMFPDITICTSGSVGVADQSMDITVQMPVPPKWQAGTTVLANAVKNQTITVPLRGTLVKPALDQRVVQQLSAQFMKKAAGNVIEGELNRLFTPRK
jgi:translocation and assembly module TamB